MWLAIWATLPFGQVLAQDKPPPAQAGSAPPQASADARDAPIELPIVCFSARDMNDRVARLRLANPLIVMQSNARRLRAEPLRTRLCRSGARLIYELSLIRRDGRVLLIYVNAQNGRLMASPRN